MKASFLSRKWHKWLFLVIGVQMCLWAISGFYMVTMSIDYIHGDHLVQEKAPPPLHLTTYTYPVNQVMSAYPEATSIETGNLFETPVYKVHTPNGIQVINARNGMNLSPLARSQVKLLAENLYAGNGPLASLELLSDNPPSEVQTRPLPLWRANFDDPWSPSLYISPATGDLITKRHDFWRAFDFLWMLHIMDYETRSDVNNWLLRISATVITLSTVTGIWLLFYSFRRTKGQSASANSGGRFFRALHKWLGLFIGLQVTIWAVSGLTMSILDHDMVQGHDMSRHASPAPLGNDQSVKTLSDLPPQKGVMKVALWRLQDQLVYEITRQEGARLYDARSATPLTITAELSQTIAASDYAGPGALLSAVPVNMPTSDTPRLSGPAWKVDFDDGRGTALYISRETGQITGRVNAATRLFNVALMLHFMDYPGNNHFNSPWIIFTGFATLWLAISGIILIFQSFTKAEFKAAFRKITAPGTTRTLTVLDSAGGLDNQITSPYGGTIYDTLAKAEIILPSHCGGGGTCGLCRVQYADLPPVAVEADRHHFTQHELDQGYRLSCQHRLAENTAICLPEDVLTKTPFTAEVTANRKLTPTIHEIKMKLRTSEAFSYDPGSYMLVDIPGIDAAPLKRAYSLATPPQDAEEIVFNIRRIPAPTDQSELPAGVGSHYMCDLQAGDSVTLSGPFGHFKAQDSDNEMIFIGGGAGMAPLRAIIRDQLLHKHTRRKISFWYGVRNTTDIFYQEEFAQLEQQHANMTFQIGLSDPVPQDNWQGLSGYIHEITMKNYLADHPDLTKVEFYLCGPPAMLKATRSMLKQLDIDESKIAFDDFGI